ncbi:hypothetical protein C1H46_023124 [Malus baccata]|uniref:Terpene synthase N-terminal domain-containing protein n=1 Tax=Malus baccata TaxID=106549 RepID=A0A540LXQ8_MALBA|nr:hypothetical protein C1H46_023124 [Malus baccata]
MDAELEQHVQELKEEVRRMLTTSLQNVSQKLNFVDDIQRLGVSYHFRNEIEQILQKIHANFDDLDDLYTAALRFQLLRQQGYNISCDIFNKFKDGDGKFKESLVDDVVGLLSLYEATQLRIHGEEILDEALTFTTTHLESATYRLSPLAKTVTHALNQQLRKALPRVEARYYLSVYQELRESPNESLLTFAKSDFNRLQRVHQKELSEITRWWEDLDVPNKLPFVRDRLVEVYFCWSLSVYFEPQYSFGRRTLCKVTAITSMIDDFYNAYGTYEELELLTEAIERWDFSAMDQLPEYMKVCYRALLDIYSEIHEKLAHEGKLYPMHHAREAFEQNKKEHFVSAVNCYMKKYDTTEEEAIIELQRQVNNTWKDVNEACLQPTAVPMPQLIRILNFARVMDVVYKCEDGYTNPEGVLKDFIVSTLVEPVAQ